jgi:hypothetical protein
MDSKPLTPASTSPVTIALAVGVFVCVGGGLIAVVAGASGQLAAGALFAGAILTVTAVVLEHQRSPNIFSLTARSPFDAPADRVSAPLRNEGESWISVDPTYAAYMKRMVRLAYFTPFFLLLPWLLMRHHFVDPSMPVGVRAVALMLEILVWGMALVMVVAVIFMRHALKRTLRTRIGANRTHLLHDAGTGEIERHEWSTVLTDKFHLLIGNRIVPMVRPWGLRQRAIFPAESLRAVILPRLRAESFAGRGRFMWNAFLRGNLSLWAAASTPCSMLVLQFLMKQYPEWFKAAREAVQAWALASVS